MYRSVCASFAFALLAAALAAPAPAADFPPISAQEKALTAVPGHPNAAAVVLFRKGDFRMMDLARGEQASTLEVQARVKILSEQGKKDFGEIEIYHNRNFRLKQLAGRTVLPDGRTVPLDDKSVFERQASQSRRLAVTAVAFPAVEVGAILEYRYEIKWDSFYTLEPWVFQEEVPVLLSEIVYHLPGEISARAWSRDPTRAGIQHEAKKSAIGTDIRVWAVNLPPILDEPFSFPPEDLTARFMLVPTKYAGTEPLLETWATTCEIVEDGSYAPARRNDTAARRRAKELAGPSPDPKARALALYRFVRDEIETEPWPSVVVDVKQGPDIVLGAKRGAYAEKALLLETLLNAVKIDAQLVWAASRRDGLIDTELPTLAWFDRMLVQAKIGAEIVYLDPSERGLGFGQLTADHEGTKAVLFHPRKPQVITLPSDPFDANRRQATLELALDAEGKLTGTGAVVFTGHHAADRIAAARAGEGPEKDLTDWLSGRFDGFVVKDVKVEQAVDERRVEVRFALDQPAEEVLGSEASFHPSRPLGPVRQPLPVPAESRATPLMFDFADRDTLEITFRWPDSWEIEGRPADSKAEGAVGAFSATIEVDEADRTLRYSRRFDTNAAQYMGRDEYARVRALYSEAEKHDAQVVTLVRR